MKLKVVIYTEVEKVTYNNVDLDKLLLSNQRSHEFPSIEYDGNKNRAQAFFKEIMVSGSYLVIPYNGGVGFYSPYILDKALILVDFEEEDV